ncbi:BACON domain-containing carbohydrate-binding protein [uncultured Muribaculum sp.]|uniref:BACON domain-containing protein n=1 Tax=uncultured Muribaculum sp. TaxID=1918613 RepID=UPI0025F02DA4|nr:BACON domain-containing carbohydrate-binding protein [uncultured Muribaculum sp.]
MKSPISYLAAITAVCLSTAFTACSDENDAPNQADTLQMVSSSGNRFTGDGGTLEILVNSNVDYKVETDADWIVRMAARSVPVNGVERFLISPYPVAADMSPRTATVSISYPGTETITYAVEQTPQETFRFKVTDVSASRISSKGGEITITLDTNVDYTTTVSDPAWITVLPDTPKETVTLSIAENTLPEARQGRITFHNAESGDATVEFTQDAFVKEKGISTAEQLIEFAAAVNSGASLEQWLDENEEIVLLADIDMAGRQWTPIGNLRGSVFSNSTTTLGTDGNPFSGVFNGNGHTIRNLSMSTDAEQCFGLFGVCSGATVTNLVIDASCTLQVTNEAMASACAYGFVAGLADRTTITNVTVEGMVLESLMNKGKSKTMGTIAGIVGYACSSTIGECRFAGSIKHVRSNMYDNSLGSGVAAIAGFSRGTASLPTTIEKCTNAGDIYAETNRVAGILGSTSGNFILRDCENSGTVHAGVSEATKAGWGSGLRVGGILGFSSSTKAANVCLIERCTNTGTVVSDADAKTQTGGVVGLVRTLTLTDATNTGCVIATEGSILGLVCGQLQCADKPTVNSCRAAGSIARSYTGSGSSIWPVDAVTITADNYFQYAAGNVTGTNSGIWTTDNVKF